MFLPSFPSLEPERTGLVKLALWSPAYAGRERKAIFYLYPERGRLTRAFTPLFWKSGKRNLGLDSKSFINILNGAFGMTDKK